MLSINIATLALTLKSLYFYPYIRFISQDSLIELLGWL